MEKKVTEERTVWTEGKPYIVVLSDEREALLAAQAAGRAVVGVEKRGIEPGQPGDMEDILPVRYVVETRAAADDKYLERVLRRHLGLPWIITETGRLTIREFTVSDAADVVREDGDSEADRIFCTPELLEAYIRHQYGFYEYGLWALIERKSGRLIGKAGVTGAGPEPGGEAADETVRLELGYHIFTPYRGRGYAKEACRGILDILERACARDAGWGAAVWARTDAGNTASIRVLESCGFTKRSPDTAEQIDFWRDIRYNER